jgi:hypothetical protein
MVHRTHLDIFVDEYYPNEFDNWWIDDWMTNVYGTANTEQLLGWHVKHHIEKHGTRYTVNDKLRKHLQPAIYRGRQKILSYVKDNKRSLKTVPNYSKNFTYHVLGTTHIPMAWGPSMNKFYNTTSTTK